MGDAAATSEIELNNFLVDADYVPNFSRTKREQTDSQSDEEEVELIQEYGRENPFETGNEAQIIPGEVGTNFDEDHDFDEKLPTRIGLTQLDIYTSELIDNDGENVLNSQPNDREHETIVEQFKLDDGHDYNMNISRSRYAIFYEFKQQN